MFKKLVCSFILISGFFLFDRAGAKDKPIEDAVAFMQSLGDKVIDVIKNHTGREKRKHLKKLFKANVHHKSIAKFVLGKTRGKLRATLRTAKNDAEKETIKQRIKSSLDDFYDTYRKSIIRIYLSAFERDFKQEVFKASHANQSGQDGATVYSTLDRQNGAPPVSLHWVLKKICLDQSKCLESDRRWTVVDLRVESVSQAGKEREEALSIFSKHESACKESDGEHCAVMALEKLTQDHRDLNAAWKQRGQERFSSKPSKVS